MPLSALLTDKDAEWLYHHLDMDQVIFLLTTVPDTDFKNVIWSFLADVVKTGLMQCRWHQSPPFSSWISVPHMPCWWWFFLFRGNATTPFVRALECVPCDCVLEGVYCNPLCIFCNSIHVFVYVCAFMRVMMMYFLTPLLLFIPSILESIVEHMITSGRLEKIVQMLPQQAAPAETAPVVHSFPLEFLAKLCDTGGFHCSSLFSCTESLCVVAPLL